MAHGYIKLHRSLRHHPLWLKSKFTAGQAWVDLLMSANHADSKVLRGDRWIDVKRGQVFTSQKALASRWGWDRKTVRSFLDVLNRNQMLDIETSRSTDTGYTLLTIRNYNHFQDPANSGLDIQKGDSMGIETDIQRTLKGHPTDTSKKNKKKEKNKNIPTGAWKNYLSDLPPEKQAILQKAAEAVESTRKTGRLAPSILDRLADYMSTYPEDVVIRSCQIYIQKNYAAEGKSEKYLMGIIRGEFKSNGQEAVNTNQERSQRKTEFDIKIENAMAQQKEEEEKLPWETL